MMQIDHRRSFHRIRQPHGLTLTAVWLLVGWGPQADPPTARADDAQSVVRPSTVARDTGPAALEQWVNEPLDVKLPPAPEPFASWIELGDVHFDVYDPQREPFEFAAETRFLFHYSYRCQTHWRLIDGPQTKTADGGGGSGSDPRGSADSRRAPRASGGRALAHRGGSADSPPTPDKPTMLEVRLSYDEVKLSISHRVRLPERTVGPDFYDNALVRHEFDHVAISADPRLQARLERMLVQRNAILLEPLDDNGGDEQSYGAVASAAVRRESDRVFEDFVQSIAIRYRELDRVTMHGRYRLSAQERARLIDSSSRAGDSPSRPTKPGDVR